METFTLRNNNINGVKWKVDNARGNIFLIHGLGEYAQRYSEFAEFFNKNMFNVYAFDLPGHGHSKGVRGHIGGRMSILSIIDNLIDYGINDCDVPAFVFSHSMGGNLALTYRFFMTNSPVCAYFVSSPWLKLNKKLPIIKVFFAKILSLIIPYKTLNYSNFFNQKREISHTLGDKNLNFIKDDLIHPFISLSTFFLCEKNAKIILASAKLDMPPLLISTGENDHICNPKNTHDFANLTNATLINLKNCGHEILPHTPFYNILADIVTFFNQFLGD